MALPPEVDESVLEEGCYYLSQLGLDRDQIAERLETSPALVERLTKSYSKKLRTGRASASDFDRSFWEGVKKEAEGDVKVTFVSERGFHHAWKSELGRLDGTALMSILESSKDFLNSDPNRRFLDYPAPKGYDPLALDREVTKAVQVVTEILEEIWRKTRTGEGAGRKTKLQTS